MPYPLQDRAPLLPEPVKLSKAALETFEELAAKEDGNDNADLLKVEGAIVDAGKSDFLGPYLILIFQRVRTLNSAV